MERCHACNDPLHENEQGDAVCIYCRWAYFKECSTRDAHEYDGLWECFGCGDPWGSVSTEEYSPAVLVVYQTETRGETSVWLCEVCWGEVSIEDDSRLNDLMGQLPLAPRT